MGPWGTMNLGMAETELVELEQIPSLDLPVPGSPQREGWY